MDIKRIIYEVGVYDEKGEHIGNDTLSGIGEDNPDTMQKAFDTFLNANPTGWSVKYVKHVAVDLTEEEKAELATIPPASSLDDKKKEFDKALEQFGEKVDVPTKEDAPPILPPPPADGKQSFEFTFMIIAGIDTFDGYMPVSVEAENDKQAFEFACDEALEACPERRKIWYQGKALSSYGYVPHTPSPSPEGNIKGK